MLIWLKKHLTLFSIFIGILSACSPNSKDSQLVSNSELTSIQKIKDQYPDSIALQLQWTSALFQGGDTIAALNYLESLVKKFPKNERIINSLAYSYLSKRDTLASINTFKESLILNDKQPEIEMELAYLYASLKNDTSTLMANIMVSDFNNPIRRAHGFFALGIYLANTGDLKRAIQAYDSCMVNQFTYTDAYVEKSIALYDLNKNKESLSTLFKVMEIDSKNSDIFAWIGFNYQKLNEPEKAKEYFKEALRLNPNRIDIEEN